MIDFGNLFKIKLENANPERRKHEVVKLLLVMKLIEKYKKDRDWIRIYTEFEIEPGLKPDVYFEHIKKKVAMAYEIQKNFSGGWNAKRTKQYSEWEIPFFNSTDFMYIDINKLSNNIDEIYEELDEYLF